MVKLRREDPNGDESALGMCTAGKWVRGTSTLPKVFDQPKGSKLELRWKDKQPVGPRKHPSLFSESIGLLIATARRFDWTKNWELQDGGHKQWLWDTIKESWELEETWKDPTLGPIFEDEFRNKKSKWKRNFYTRYTTYEERLSHRTPQLSPEEWVQLVEFWDTPEHQSEEAGAPPSLGDLFVRTHTSLKTHDALDDQLRDYIDKMKELVGRDEEGTQQPLTNEIYRQVMPPERHGHVAEMQRVAQEKEEERQCEIEEIRRQAQEKDEQRQREMDEMKRQLNARDVDMEARLMQKLLEMTATCLCPFSD
ncbi:hypothetical protein IFM89_019992 [Coptis chinensis]|uniref:Uncharacterized protein n=1 Tax=Coptis chinensis TaxID=261450 RepID=A0A835I4S4_9MAGN|nr:hypothetical protein IFM89_019992 [Coptis chinensis]